MSFIHKLLMYGDEETASTQGEYFYFNRDSIDNPVEGDWRIVRNEDEKHSLVERYQEGVWTYHGDFGGSFQAGDHVLDDKTKLLYYVDEAGTKHTLVRASLIDGGAYIGDGDRGISLVHNGRLEAYRASSTVYDSGLINDGTDQITTSHISLTIDGEDYYRLIQTISGYFHSVPMGTKARITLKEGSVQWYESVSSFDFSLGFGEDVIAGENEYTFNPKLSLPSDTTYTLDVWFSNTVIVYGVGALVKYDYTYKIITPSIIPQVNARGIYAGPIELGKYDAPVEIFSFPNVVCEADVFHRVLITYNVYKAQPSILTMLYFKVGGVIAKAIELKDGENSDAIICTTSTTMKDITIEICVETAPADKKATFSNISFILEEI